MLGELGCLRAGSLLLQQRPVAVLLMEFADKPSATVPELPKRLKAASLARELWCSGKRGRGKGVGGNGARGRRGGANGFKREETRDRP